MFDANSRVELLKILIVLCLIKCAFPATIAQFLESPCPNIFQYHYDENGLLYGSVQIECPESNKIQLNIELSVGNNVEVSSYLLSGLWKTKVLNAENLTVVPRKVGTFWKLSHTPCIVWSILRISNINRRSRWIKTATRSLENPRWLMFIYQIITVNTHAHM